MTVPMQLLRSIVMADDLTPGMRCSISRHSLSTVARNVSPRAIISRMVFWSRSTALPVFYCFYDRNGNRHPVKLPLAKSLNGQLTTRHIARRLVIGTT